MAVALVLAKYFGESRRGSPTLADLAIAGGLALRAGGADHARSPTSARP